MRLAVLAMLVSSVAGAQPVMGRGVKNIDRGGGTSVLDATQTILADTSGTPCTGALLTTEQGGAVTVSRASTATCIDTNNAIMTEVSSNRAVVNANGIRIQSESTNRVPVSHPLSGSWSSSSVTHDGDVVGGMSAADASVYSTTSAGGFVESGSFTISSTSAVLSAYVWDPATSGTLETAVELYDTTAGASRCTFTTVPAGATVNVYVSPPYCSSTGIVSGNTHVVRAYPGGKTGDGTQVAFWGVQVEPGRTTPTGLIPTSGTAASRAADNITFTATGNSATGCASAHVLLEYVAGSENILSTNNGNVLAVAATNRFFASDNTNTQFGPVISDIRGVSTYAKSSWGGSALTVHSPSDSASGSFDGSIGDTGYHLGSNVSVLQYLNGYARCIKVSTDSNGCGACL